MTTEQLIEEGRRLERPCIFLRPEGDGPVAAIWYERDEDEIESTGHHCWLTVDTRHIPGLPDSITGYVSVFTDEENCESGKVELTPDWPERKGTKLYAHPASVLPPIDGVFARGSDAVGEWIASHGWDRETRYNSNFDKPSDFPEGPTAVDKYEEVWQEEYPIYQYDSDIYAVLGGWHWPMPDDDWHDLLDEQLMVLTIRDSEPWVEAWRMRTGEFKVIQRIT